MSLAKIIGDRAGIARPKSENASSGASISTSVSIKGASIKGSSGAIGVSTTSPAKDAIKAAHDIPSIRRVFIKPYDTIDLTFTINTILEEN